MTLLLKALLAVTLVVLCVVLVPVVVAVIVTACIGDWPEDASDVHPDGPEVGQ